MMISQPDRQSAIALSYTDKNKAPIVVAKGYGVVAESILRCAREHGLYVHESPELVSLLMNVDLDDQIPPQLYVAVAELLAWLYHLESRAPVEAAEIEKNQTQEPYLRQFPFKLP
jgi:flagellar biosynthesis protein